MKMTNTLLLQITSTDGYSCSGQTPVIAWQKFQKNCYPHTKIWQGKRFSCTIDGMEVNLGTFLKSVQS